MIEEADRGEWGEWGGRREGGNDCRRERDKRKGIRSRSKGEGEESKGRKGWEREK